MQSRKIDNLANWFPIVREEEEELTAKQGLQRRAKFFQSVGIPGFFYSQDDFPALCSKKTSREREAALLKFLATDGSSSPRRRTESEGCCEKVKEVLKPYKNGLVGYSCVSDGQNKYLYYLISTICDVPWLADKVVCVTSLSNRRKARVFSVYFDDETALVNSTPDAQKSTGGIAEIFPELYDTSNYLALIAATCRQRGWKFNSTGTATSAFLYAFPPYDYLTVEILHITLKATGPPEYDSFYRVMFDLEKPSEIFKAQQVLLWIANENGGRLEVRQTLDPCLVINQKEDRMGVF